MQQFLRFCSLLSQLHKLVRWFDGIKEEKERITSDALSHR